MARLTRRLRKIVPARHKPQRLVEQPAREDRLSNSVDKQPFMIALLNIKGLTGD
jgi:hypothetical protein